MKHISYIIKFQISPYIIKFQIPRGFNIDLKKSRCWNIKQPKYCQIPNVRRIYHKFFKIISPISKKIYITCFFFWLNSPKWSNTRLLWAVCLKSRFTGHRTLKYLFTSDRQPLQKIFVEIMVLIIKLAGLIYLNLYNSQFYIIFLLGY